MANTELVRLSPDASQARIVAAINALIDSSLGNLGARVLMVGHDGTATDPNLGTSAGTGLYQTVIRSGGTNHLQVRNSADTQDRLTVTDTATTTPDLVATATLASNGTTTLGDAAGDALTVNATSTFVAPSSFNGNVTLGDAAADTLTVHATPAFNALSTFNAGATFAAGQPVTGNATLQFKAPLSAVASAPLALTTSWQDVAGCALSLTPGAWLVLACVDFVLDDASQGLRAQLVTTGGTATIALSAAQAFFQAPAAATRATAAQAWLVTVAATTTVKLQGDKTGGAGASVIYTLTTLTAINA
jgi:hypothetical protein